MNNKDANTKIQYLKDLVAEFIKERDWEKYHNPKDLAISIAIETGELLELFQWRKPEDINMKIEKEKDYVEKIREELADIMIYCISLANRVEIDITQAIIDKIKKNKVKYPIGKKLDF